MLLFILLDGSGGSSAVLAPLEGDAARVGLSWPPAATSTSTAAARESGVLKGDPIDSTAIDRCPGPTTPEGAACGGPARHRVASRSTHSTTQGWEPGV